MIVAFQSTNVYQQPLRHSLSPQSKRVDDIPPTDEAATSASRLQYEYDVVDESCGSKRMPSCYTVEGSLKLLTSNSEQSKDQSDLTWSLMNQFFQRTQIGRVHIDSTELKEGMIFISAHLAVHMKSSNRAVCIR